MSHRRPSSAGGPSARPSPSLVARLAATCAAGTGVLHLALVPEHLHASYLGALFVFGGVGSLIAGVALWRAPHKWGWGLGGLTAGAMAVGLLASRSVGLPGVFGMPGVHESEWRALEDIALLLELGFLTLAWLEWGERRRPLRAASRQPAAPTSHLPDPPRSVPIPSAGGLSRRRALAAVVPLVGAGAAGRLFGGPSLGLSASPASAAAMPGMGSAHPAAGAGANAQPMGGHGLGFRGGSVDHRANGFDPSEVVRDFDWGKTRRLASGRVLREWEIVASDKDVEIAPGITFPAWTYNGRIPGPTLRCHEGELLRIKFANGSAHPHTMHFHGIHPAGMDGSPGVAGIPDIKAGQRFVYDFEATPFGMHLYHCHVHPLAMHIAKGLYGAFIVDPKQGRPQADELIMVMNGFNTNFDGQGNQVYAVNTVGFAYEQAPIRVKRGELVRIYLANLLEFDPINSFHIHANFFHYYPTGTSLQPSEYTDTIAQMQGQRGILELRFPHAGQFLFHAHKTEFAELGWLGLFEVED